MKLITPIGIFEMSEFWDKDPTKQFLTLTLLLQKVLFFVWDFAKKN